MSQLIDDHATTYMVAVQVCNGGVIVHARIWCDVQETVGVTTSVFSDLDSMASYIKRVCKDWEGSSEVLERLGPLKVDS